MIEYASRSIPGEVRWTPMRLAAWASTGIAWSALAIFFMAALTIILGVIFRPAGAFGPFLVFVAIVVIASAVRDARRRGAMAALVYVEQAVRLNLPLTPMLASARLAERPAVARRILHMEELLAAGTTVADALETACPELPGRSLRAVRMAERLGRLPEALARLVDATRPREPHDPTRSLYRSYPLLLLSLVSLMVMLIMIFVMPKFEQILQDFQMPMPRVTGWLIDFSQALGPVLAVLSCFLVLLLAGRAMWDVCAPRRARLALRWATDPVEWSLPLLGRAAMDGGMADLCWMLADSVEGGLPMPQVLAEAERLDVNAMLGARIKRWGRLVEAGEPLAAAARKAGMPSVFVGMIETSTVDLAGVFRFLARHYAGRFSRAEAVVRAAAVPMIAIVMGVVVALLAMSILLPLIRMTDHLAPQIGGTL